MIEYVLILFINSSIEGASVGLTNIPHFQTNEECQNAGKAASALTKQTLKAAKFVCVPQTVSKS